MLTGLDTNILCYALNPAYSEHQKLKNLLVTLSLENTVALNSKTLHETYRTLVFGQKWVPQETRRRLRMLLTHQHIEFFNQSKKSSVIALNLSMEHKLSGRDTLIIANFLSNKVPTIYTHDQELRPAKKFHGKTSAQLSRIP